MKLSIQILTPSSLSAVTAVEAGAISGFSLVARSGPLFFSLTSVVEEIFVEDPINPSEPYVYYMTVPDSTTQDVEISCSSGYCVGKYETYNLGTQTWDSIIDELPADVADHSSYPSTLTIPVGVIDKQIRITFVPLFEFNYTIAGGTLNTFALDLGTDDTTLNTLVYHDVVTGYVAMPKYSDANPSLLLLANSGDIVTSVRYATQSDPQVDIALNFVKMVLDLTEYYVQSSDEPSVSNAFEINVATPAAHTAVLDVPAGVVLSNVYGSTLVTGPNASYNLSLPSGVDHVLGMDVSSLGRSDIAITSSSGVPSYNSIDGTLSFYSYSSVVYSSGVIITATPYTPKLIVTVNSGATITMTAPASIVGEQVAGPATREFPLSSSDTPAFSVSFAQYYVERKTTVTNEAGVVSDITGIGNSYTFPAAIGENVLSLSLVAGYPITAITPSFVSENTYQGTATWEIDVLFSSEGVSGEITVSTKLPKRTNAAAVSSVTTVASLSAASYHSQYNLTLPDYEDFEVKAVNKNASGQVISTVTKTFSTSKISPPAFTPEGVDIKVDDTHVNLLDLTQTYLDGI